MGKQGPKQLLMMIVINDTKEERWVQGEQLRPVGSTQYRSGNPYQKSTET